MTVTEFSNEFDILYDNVASKGAPGLDLYEKSVYLTKAQLEVVKTKYSLNNQYKKGFENSEKRRADLKELIVQYTSIDRINSSANIVDDSYFFKVPDNMFLIINERATIKTASNCTKDVGVVPKTHDEFNIQINNPFKKPDNTTVWRLDYSKQSNNVNVELISTELVTKYKVRYIKYPAPIILTNLSAGDFQGENLSIEGSILPKTSELNKNLHSEILDRAVELAVRDYKESSLQNKVQLNLRNE